MIKDLNITQTDLFNGVPSPSANRRRPIRNEAIQTAEFEPKRSVQTVSDENEEPNRTSSSPKKPFKLRYLLLLLIVVAGISTWSWQSNTMLQVTTIQVKNEYFSSAKSILLKTGIPLGIPADSLNYRQIIQRIEQLPYVKQAFIVEIPPHTLEIRIEERRPIGLLILSDQTLYIDEEGVLLPTIPDKMPEVPLVYGLRIPPGAVRLSGKPLQIMSRFLIALDQNELSKITLSDIAWIDTIGIIAITGDYGTKLTFGVDDFDRKLRAWNGFYTQIVPKIGLNTITSVDLRYRDQIVTDNLPTDTLNTNLMPQDTLLVKQDG